MRQHPDHTTGTAWGLAAEGHERPLASITALGAAVAWAPMAEVYGDDHGDRWLAAALRLTLRPDALYVDVSWAQQLRLDRARILQAGLRLAF